MPPESRFAPRFAAEPPQEPIPYGRWADTLRELFLAACRRAGGDSDEDPGEPGEIAWYPDRTWNGRTYVPATTRTSRGWEYLGYVSFPPATDTRSAEGFEAVADLTEDPAEQTPDWATALNDEAIGIWRCEDGKVPT